MSIEEFLGRLQGVTADGQGGWMACCPAHDDHNPSMHVNRGDDGRILVKCFAGCTVDEIVGAMGLDKKDLMAEAGDTARKGKRRNAASSSPAPLPSVAAPKKERDYGVLVCEYVYKDESGATVYKVERRKMKNGKKTFIQKSPDPDNPQRWRFGVDKWGVPYIPYRLPDIRKAAEKHVPVVIVEGEKDAENVVKHLHMVATCNPKGAGKWQKGWGDYFKGVPSLLIIADKDPMTKVDKKTGEEKLFAVGQRHACDVEEKLRADGYEGKIRKIVLPDIEIDGEENGIKTVRMVHVKDFTDWVDAMTQAGREVSKSALKSVIDAFGEWPETWRFAGADLSDLQRAQKSARDTASEEPVQAESAEEAGDKEPEVETVEWTDRGRYGRPAPRPPVKDERLYEVDFDIKPTKKALITIGLESMEFQAWTRADSRNTYTSSKPIKASGSISELIGAASGLCWRANDCVPLKGPQVTDLTCKMIVAWLRARGRFFADESSPMYDTSMFFDEADGMLYALHSAEFQSFLAATTDLNRELKSFKMLMSVIDDLAMDSTLTPRVRPAKQWSRKDGAIYMSNGDSKAYKISAGKVELVDNGTDGVLFLRGETFAPWTLLDGPGLDPFAHATVFRTAAWGDTHSLMNIRLWFLNLFACHSNKPILLLEGPAGCGKTTVARMIKRILAPRSEGLPDTNVNQVNAQDKGAEDFWVVIDQGRLEVFDNMDSKVKWANDNLQTAATNGSHKVRELYKTKKVAILYANSSIIITSNNPIFATDGGGLPDRIIQGHITSGRKVSLDNELITDIDNRRDEYLTWTARTLAAALADTAKVDDSINRRHPDYGIFAVKCARVMGVESEAIGAMSAAEIDKSVLPIVNHAVAKEIYAVLMDQPTKGSMKFTAKDMTDAILARLGEDDTDEKTKTIYSSRRVGKALSTFKKEFSVLFRMRDVCTINGNNTYESDGLTPQGETLVANKVDMVDLKRDFAKTSSGAGNCGDFFENAPTNPPNPPYARAPAHDDPSLREEENGEEWGFDL